MSEASRFVQQPRSALSTKLEEYRELCDQAVVLLSGGLDSTVLAAACIQAGLEVVALTIAYGQRHAVEIEAASEVASALGIRRHEFLELPVLGSLGSSALTDSERPLTIGTARPNTYVPARNVVLLAHGLALAESMGCRVVLAGANAADATAYPDCRKSFFDALSLAASTGTRLGETGPVIMDAPLALLSKAEVVRIGFALGAPLHLTHSCYSPIGRNGCGVCDACCLRAHAFVELGVGDPALQGEGAPASAGA